MVVNNNIWVDTGVFFICVIKPMTILLKIVISHNPEFQRRGFHGDPAAAPETSATSPYSPRFRRFYLVQDSLT